MLQQYVYIVNATGKHMQTYLTPIGYDTRRVTRPVVHNGIDGDDVVVLLRPDDESDTEQARQAIADVRQMLLELEPAAELTVERIATTSLDRSILTCCDLVEAAHGRRIVTLGGGARDVLLPLLVGTLARIDLVDDVLFYSDLDHSVREWRLPNLIACPPDRTRPTHEALLEGDGPLSLSEVAEVSGQSKSTVVRHVNDLDESGVVRTHQDGQTKYAELSLTGRLLVSAED